MSNQKVLVTGGSRGIGRALVSSLAAEGCDVSFTYNSHRKAAEDLVSELADSGHKVTPYAAQLDTRGGTQAFLDECSALLSQIDVLINNAGAIIRPADWMEQTLDDLYRTLEVNLVSPIRLIQAVASGMKTRRYGRIINLATTFSIHGAAPVLSYTSAKAGIVSATYALAKELGGSGITVNAVAPGNFDTDMTRGAGPETTAWAISTTPSGRLGQPKEIADAVRYLVASEFVNGHVLVVDGGQLLNM